MLICLPYCGFKINKTIKFIVDFIHQVNILKMNTIILNPCKSLGIKAKWFVASKGWCMAVVDGGMPIMADAQHSIPI